MNYNSERTTENHDILYVGPFGFPVGGAAARRVLGVCLSLKKAGFSVGVVSGQMESNTNDNLSMEDVPVYSTGERTAEHLPTLIKHALYVKMGERTIRWLDNLQTKPHTIILYSGYTPYLLRLIPWCKANNIHLVFDAVEWYQPNSTIGYLSPYQLNIEYALRKLLPKVGNVISISSYLHNYYVRNDCHTVIVPPTLDIVNLKCRTAKRAGSDYLEVVYTGTPGRKDLLNEILDAVLHLAKSGYKIRLTIAGVTEKESNVYPSLTKYDDSIRKKAVVFLGYLEHEKTLELVRNSDYSLLLRKQARYSMAGFSTKFVESFALGTPVIANITGDLGNYLIDYKTGFVSATPDRDGLILALKNAVSAHENSLQTMRESCREVALANFDYRSYSEKLSNFVKLLNSPDSRII